MIWNWLDMVRPDRWVGWLFFSCGLTTKAMCGNPRTSISNVTHHTISSTWNKLDSCPEFTVFRAGCSLKILLTRPEKGNSLTLATIARLITLFQELSTDNSIYRIVLTSQGKYFCTGMDLREQRSISATNHFSALYDLFEAIDNCPQTTIAAINGPAYGGGVGLAFVFDIRIALADATMCLSEVKLGLCPATISKFVVREWGIGMARMAMISGRKIYPEELYRMGTVHMTVSHNEELEVAIDQWLADLKFTAPKASAWCKKLARDAWRDAGGELQFQTTKSSFVAMMAEDSESHKGVEDFRNGIRGTNWEEVLYEDNISLEQKISRLPGII